MFISWMLIMPSFKKSLIVEQFQGNYLNLVRFGKLPVTNTEFFVWSEVHIYSRVPLIRSVMHLLSVAQFLVLVQTYLFY